ncbi:homoserine kinase [Barrientosiimonas marina]|uniref:Homoserine kinase n=1 Tax=Lentibacillus kimchii TaxID=1542911 RepID=A0ABW2UVY3_9BACI
MTPFRIVVPASSANLGPGFDSLGLALSLYLTVDVSASDAWEIEQHSAYLPEQVDAYDHLIVSAARETAAHWHEQLPPCHLSMQSDIPLARGLGSSASAIVAGIELADRVCCLSLTADEKLQLGASIEGHPDNIAPAVMGGLVISAAADGVAERVLLPVPDVETVLAIPGEALTTEAARDVLPAVYTREQAASASAISNVLVAALAAGDYARAGRMMEQDLFHEPYRQAMLPHYETIRSEAGAHGAYGTVISGAGPAMISFLPEGKGDSLVSRLQDRLPDYQVMRLKPDPNGVLSS